MGDMFTPTAKLGGIFTDASPLDISECHHSTSMQIVENEAEIASGTSIICFFPFVF